MHFDPVRVQKSFLLSVAFDPAAPLRTWEYIDKCTPMCCADWPVLMLWIWLPQWPKQNPCSALQLGHGGQVRAKSPWLRNHLLKLLSGYKEKWGFRLFAPFLFPLNRNRNILNTLIMLHSVCLCSYLEFYFGGQCFCSSIWRNSSTSHRLYVCVSL